MKPLEMTVTETQAYLVVELVGDMDLSTVETIRERLLETTGTGTGVVILDLGGVRFLDSTALTLFVTVHRRLTEQGRLLLLANVSRRVGRPIAVTGVDQVVTVHWTDQPVRPWQRSPEAERLLSELTGS